MMVARYQQLAADLRKGIADGTYPRGSTIPPISELTDRYGISKAMVSQALRIIENEGLVRPERGRGTVVLDQRIVVFPLRTWATVNVPGGGGAVGGPWQTACVAQGINGDMKAIEVVTEPAPADVTVALDLEPGADAIRRTRNATIDDIPVQIQHAYYPTRFPQLAQPGRVEGGVYGLLATMGVHIERCQVTFQSRNPTPEEAAELGLRGEAVSAVTRISYDAEARPVEVLHIIATRTKFVLDDVTLSP